jgi:triacylglycerol lipase
MPHRRAFPLLALLSAAVLAGVGCGEADGATATGGSGGNGGELTGAGGAGATSGHTTSATTATGTGGAGGGVAKLGPPYPLVLAHGFFGFEDFAGAGFLTYYYGVREHLESQGELVLTPAVDPFNDSTARGTQLILAIEAFLAETGHEKVNLIAHSQGGLDARVVAHLRPDLIASVTTLATPHQGTPIADIAMGLVSDPKYQDVLDWLVNTVGAPLYDAVGNETSVSAAMQQMSTPGIAAFNATYTDSPGVKYWSITGRTDYAPGGGECQADRSVLFVDSWDNELDPTDGLLFPTESILSGNVFDQDPNDGLVRVKDARWGEFLGCVPADHLDEVGQLLGDGPGLGNGWDYVAFYDDLVRFLRGEGL